MIRTEDVKINTMQVEIRSMIVGRKQLTLSLMRQFIEEDIIDHEQLALKGIPWGHINYFWGEDKWKSYPRYIQVIWQKDIYLRRCIVPMFLDSKSNSENIKWANEIIAELKVQELNNNDISLSYSYRFIYDDNKRSERILMLRNELEEAKDEINYVNNYNNVHIPNYLKLVEPFKNLEHFYIAV